MKHFPCLVATFVAVAAHILTPLAYANDGYIAYGGSPSLLSGHPSVAMKSEVVKMTISQKTVTVDCRFVFKNFGKKCEVRMGFPDEGDREDSSDWKTKPAKSTFNWFKSWVDGKSTKTELIRSNQPGSYWHAKTVGFAAGETKTVRDLYNVNIGLNMEPKGSGYYRQAYYVLHTGKSWRGKIGRSEVVATFSLPMHAKTVKPSWYRFDEKTYRKVDWKSLKNGKVFYRGPKKATAKALTMRFVRTNWEPEKKDDVWLAFGIDADAKSQKNWTVKNIELLPVKCSHKDCWAWHEPIKRSDWKESTPVKHGNIRLQYGDGRKEQITFKNTVSGNEGDNGNEKGATSDPKIAPDGVTIGWTRGTHKPCTDWSIKGTMFVNSKLVLFRQGKVLRILEVPGTFISGWRFWNGSKQVAIGSRWHHGLGYVRLFDVQTGKQLERLSTPDAEKKKLKWAEGLTL